jgi:hypothetical protein
VVQGRTHELKKSGKKSMKKSLDKTVMNILRKNISDAEYAREARKQMDALTGVRIASWQIFAKS